MGGGVWGQKQVCGPERGLSFLAFYSKLHFAPEENFLVLGGWFGLGGGGPPDHPPSRPPPPPHLPVDKHSPALVASERLGKQPRSR